MQTFLPYPDFDQSARCLDDRRLGKQRSEALILLHALLGDTVGWVNHPACRMWRGYEGALAEYGLAVCSEWVRRGKKDTCYEKIATLRGRLPPGAGRPPWLGREDFHASHRSNLLRKDPAWYGRFGWAEPATLKYVWPV